MPYIRTMVLGALAVGAQAFSSTPTTLAPTPSPTPMPTPPTTTTGGLPPCGPIDDNGLNCPGLLKADGICYFSASYGAWTGAYGAGGSFFAGGSGCDCTNYCCSDDDAVFENGECDTTATGR